KPKERSVRNYPPQEEQQQATRQALRSPLTGEPRKQKRRRAEPRAASSFRSAPSLFLRRGGVEAADFDPLPAFDLGDHDHAGTEMVFTIVHLRVIDDVVVLH